MEFTVTGCMQSAKSRSQTMFTWTAKTKHSHLQASANDSCSTQQEVDSISSVYKLLFKPYIYI